MWDETNPTSLYLGTTWELISAGKYVKTGSTALQTGGNNSITLSKDNLPGTVLKINSFTLTQNSHGHKVRTTDGYDGNCVGLTNKSFNDTSIAGTPIGSKSYAENSTTGNILIEKTQPAISSASPVTEILGKGTAITIQPEYITLKYWKKTS